MTALFFTFICISCVFRVRAESTTRPVLKHRYLIAGATHSAAHHLVDMSREWRRNINSFYSTNGTHTKIVKNTTDPVYNTSEVFMEYPDGPIECTNCHNVSTHDKKGLGCERPWACGWQGPHGFYWHEQRYLATPMLANITFTNQYDWMLFSDSETVWIPENVERMVKKLNPSTPFFIAESFFPHTRGACVFPGHTPILHPTCTESPDIVPCTHAAILNTDDDCAHTEGPGQEWAGGDWGFLLSRGLMQHITKEQWQKCIDCDEKIGHVCYGGGDVRIGECIFSNGFAPTLPDRDYTGINGNVRLGADPSEWFAKYQHAINTKNCNSSVDWTLPLSFHLANKKNMEMFQELYTEFQKVCTLR